MPFKHNENPDAVIVVHRTFFATRTLPFVLCRKNDRVGTRYKGFIANIIALKNSYQLVFGRPLPMNTI